MAKKIAALFVQENGPYFDHELIDAYGIERDARSYTGKFPVICHPPCERWGSYWFGGPSAKVRKKLGDDDGCFKSAVETVRKNGGVLEHPARTHAWKNFGINKPPITGGWVDAGDGIGFTCHVEQGHYGHPARKPTWLYAVNVDLPELKWGKAEGKTAIEESFPSNEARKIARANDIKPIKRIKKIELIHTPQQFRDLLISMALSASKD